MSVRFQIVVDGKDVEGLARFWAAALKYVPEPPPQGFASWREFYVSLGVTGDDLDIGTDSIVDPNGVGPRIWFHRVPEDKVVKNRLHFDLKASGERSLPFATRRAQVEAEVSWLEQIGARRLETDNDESHNRYAVAMADSEGNEFDVN